MKEIKELLKITAGLSKKYNRGFTLDGKLVGDIGEVLVAEQYNLKLFPENYEIYDAQEKNGKMRKVQIKSSFKNYCYFPGLGKAIPEYFISVNITEDGDLEELFNGPGEFLVKNYIQKRKLKPSSEYTLSPNILKTLNQEVNPEDQIPKKIINNP